MSVINGSVEKVNPHFYILDVFTVGEKGLEKREGKKAVPLVRGSKIDGENKIEKQDGVLAEQLLEVSSEYLRSVNVGEMRTRETDMAIAKIEEAMMWLNKRSEDRAGRRVLNTYQK